MVSRRRHEDPCIEAEYVTPESELMWSICDANLHDCDADELDDVESMVLEYRAEIEAAARADERKKVLAKINAIVAAPAPVAHGLLDDLRAYLRGET